MNGVSFGSYGAYTRRDGVPYSRTHSPHTSRPHVTLNNGKQNKYRYIFIICIVSGRVYLTELTIARHAGCRACIPIPQHGYMQPAGSKNCRQTIYMPV